MPTPTFEAQPVRLIRCTTVADVQTDQVKVGGYTLVYEESTNKLYIAEAGVLVAIVGGP